LLAKVSFSKRTCVIDCLINVKILMHLALNYEHQLPVTKVFNQAFAT
jgi:hypothetical protein